jgi:tRNA (guanine-N7-)-methyltransferase
VTPSIPLIEFPRTPLDWDALFAKRLPIQVEVGAGKGRFLIRAAETDPASNWVGLERRWSALALGVERIARRGLTNALYIRCDAMEVVRRLIPPGSVSVFHVYYPDPWWKDRHRKRRVFQPAFVADLARGLRDDGELRLATDVGEYFAEILEVVAASGLFEPLALPPEAWGSADEPMTSYEAKYLPLGRKPLRAAFTRGRAEAPPPEPWVSRKPPGAPLGERLIAPKLAERPGRTPGGNGSKA